MLRENIVNNLKTYIRSIHTVSLNVRSKAYEVLYSQLIFCYLKCYLINKHFKVIFH